MPLRSSKGVAFAVGVSILLATWLSAADDLSVLPDDVAGGAKTQMLRRKLLGMAAEAFHRRRVEYESLETAEQIAEYQRRRREFFIKQLGGLPEKTPLNARVVGKLLGDGFRVEKVIFESLPGFFVSAMLFLPEGEPPFPGVLIPCGHTANGKAGYQHVAALLAKNGLAAFCYDPIGQGERYQLLDDAGKPRFKSTTEHTMVGVSSMLVGRNTASYRVWDGIRALDYLASRKEIDADRLGCTGNSGGGTLTEYLMALDDRIVCAAPSCCVTSFERRLQKLGPGDAEQNIFGQIAFGLDHADYTLMRAPRPTLLCAATQDFVDINGSWEIFRETKRLYTRMGHAERVDLIEADAKHGFSLHLRVGVTRWMRRWLLGKDDAINEDEFEPFTASDLQCTPRGQTLLLKGALSVMDLNAAEAEKHAAHRKKLWIADDRRLAKESVRKIAGIRPLADLPPGEFAVLVKVVRESYTMEKLLLATHDGIVLPMLLFQPRKTTGDHVLFINGTGMAAAAGAGGPIEKLVAGGSTVLAVDLSGMGEIGDDGENQWGGDWYEIFLAYLLGKPIVGIRAEDTLIAARWYSEKSKGKLRLIATGVAGAPGLHAAALEPQLFDRVELKDTTTSWHSILKDPAAKGQLVNSPHAALTAYDLIDLAESLKRDGVTH